MNVAKETEKLKQSLVSVINSSSLPITIKRYVTSDIYRELELEYNKQLLDKESDN